MDNKIKEILDKEVRPMLAMHLGDLDFVSFENGVVKLKMKGNCQGCPLSIVTLKAGIEQILKSKIP
ncbi:MAG: NifU family protein, partial [Patescibacteria group bacterium]